MAGDRRSELAGTMRIEIVPESPSCAIPKMCKPQSAESEEDNDSSAQRAAFGSTMRIDILSEPDVASKVSAKKPVAPDAGTTASSWPTGKMDDDWQSRYQALFDGMYDAAFITGANGVIEISNRRASDFLLFSRKDLIGRNIVDFISGADAALLGRLVEDMKHQRFALIQGYCMRRDESVFPSEISVNFADSDMERLCFFVRDVTVRKQKEDKLIEQYSAIQHAANGIAMSDLSGVLKYANPATASIFGYDKAAELVGKNVAGLLGVGNEMEATTIVQRVAQGRGKWSGDLIARRSGGSTFHVNVLIGSSQDSEGVLTGLVFSFVDISDRVAATNRLRELDETKSRFVAEASHELRTPLAIITEFVSLVHDEVTGTVNEKQKECLDSALRNCTRLSTLINTMLDLARIESGKIKIERKRNAIEPILSEVYKNFQPTCKSRRQTLCLKISEDPPDVFCDVDSVHKILTNLVGNAIKFTPEGGEVTIACSREGQVLKIEVVDNGRGISEDAQKAVFEAFWQVEREDGPGAKGTGLGLAIVKKLVELNGGTVAMRSSKGKGSCFFFTLPLYAKDARIPTRILIVDDDPMIVEVVTRALGTLDVNMEIKSTLSGLESLLLAGEYNPHLVILDVRLGDIGGQEILGLLQQQAGKDERAKILAVSGDESLLGEMIRKGADDCLLKPFEADLLLAKVRALVGRRMDSLE